MHREVVDVLENKSYGEFSTYNPGDKKYWELKPTICRVRMGSDMVACEDIDRFQDMIRAYMEG